MATHTQTFTPSSAIDEAGLNEHEDSGTLTFPETLVSEFRHLMHLQRYEYSRADAKTKPTTTPTGKLITLPVPEDLGVSYGAGWENKSLGIMGDKARDLVSKIKSDASRSGSLADAVKSNLGSGSQIFATLKSLAGGAATDAVTGSDIGETVLNGLGLARNPYQSLLYEAPEIRTFNFEWKLISANAHESETLRQIIAEFKLGMHPTFDPAMQNNLFKYPDIWVIEFPSPKYLFRIANCVLTEAEFDYHGEGTPTYFRVENESVPLSVKVGLKFSEVSVLTRKDIEAGF